MTYEEFNKKIYLNFTYDELKNINPKIYLNKEHIKYYENYHLGKYKWCYDYLIKNRHLLSSLNNFNIKL